MVMKNMWNSTTILAILSIFLAIGLFFNVLQCIKTIGISQTVEADSRSLEKYRQLQEQQIQDTYTYCKNGRKAYDASDSTYYLSYILLRDLFENKELAEAYRLDVAYANCYSSALVLLGEHDIYTITYDRMSELGDYAMELKEGIFDSVRW